MPHINADMLEEALLAAEENLVRSVLNLDAATQSNDAVGIQPDAVRTWAAAFSALDLASQRADERAERR